MQLQLINFRQLMNTIQFQLQLHTHVFVDDLWDHQKWQIWAAGNFNY